MTTREPPTAETTQSSILIDDRYRLRWLVGCGATAEVYAADDHRLIRPVAIKLLYGSGDADRFEDSARTAARLCDPHIVAMYDLGKHQGRSFAAMELLTGRTLRDEIDTGVLTERRARHLAIQVLLALRTAHREGVVHRDIKPGNILLTRTGDAKLGDFGIAKVARSPDTVGLVLGTPSYLAPERVRGEAATPSTDLYAVGVVLYEALTGRAPFEGDTVPELCQATLAGDAQPLRAVRPGVSAEMADVVARALARDPSDRFPSAEEMIAALDAAARPARIPISNPAEAATVPVPRVTGPSTQRLAFDASARMPPPRRAVNLAIGAAAVAIVALSIGLLARTQHAPPATTRSSTRPPATIPAPLAHAIDDLERAIRP